MNKNDELHKILIEVTNLHLKSDYQSHKGSILLLLKEFARRMLLWKKTIEEKEKKVELGSNILFDIAFTIIGNQYIIPDIKKLVEGDELVLSYFDKLMLSASMNWLMNKNIITELGYDSLPDPYEPYLELFKRGAHYIKYEYSKLEIYPFLGVIISPIEDYLTCIPFYINQIELEEADKKESI